jgi:hypothetical protein
VLVGPCILFDDCLGTALEHSPRLGIQHVAGLVAEEEVSASSGEQMSDQPLGSLGREAAQPAGAQHRDPQR